MSPIAIGSPAIGGLVLLAAVLVGLTVVELVRADRIGWPAELRPRGVA